MPVTGRVFWSYSYSPSPQSRPCCGRVNRGVAIVGEHAVHGHHRRALDRARRQERPSSVEYGGSQARGRLRHHARAAGDQGQGDCRQWRAASSASAASSRLTTFETGKEDWRFNTIPGPGEPGHETWAGDSWKTGGASVWVTGSYDPSAESDLLGNRQRGPGLQRRCAPGRQSLQQFSGRARCRYRQAQVALPVLAARRVRLRRGAGPGAGRHQLARVSRAR